MLSKAGGELLEGDATTTTAAPTTTTAAPATTVATPASPPIVAVYDDQGRRVDTEGDDSPVLPSM